MTIVNLKYDYINNNFVASHNDNNRINPKTNSNFQVWYCKIDDTTLGIKVQIQNVFFLATMELQKVTMCI